MLSPELTRVRQLETENNKLKSENNLLNEKLDKARSGVIDLLKSLRPYFDTSERLRLDRYIKDLE